ncbi:MltR family transcriptional regulator [Actinobacillus capsulatus]|uniref:MltR family transcriptional regulator n=1 Tax=Actinobacillus capsulatus TaxID=717 RepID=UPI00035D7669|nr:MltR family transcriptional regulator [Actinobacillus capsulatus]
MPYSDNFIEQLSEVSSLRGFLALATNQFARNVDRLIQRVFRKGDFALKSVVDSLFEYQGPLAELPVRLKLLLGLGVVSAEVFEDITLFIELKQYLSDEVEELPFSHPAIVQFAKDLHHIDFAPAAEMLKHQVAGENKDSMLFQMQQIRLERIMRSSLILAITEINEKLNVESPL